MSTAPPEISVIIPTLNEADCLEQTILSARSPSSEILVIDGGSRDATLRIARRCGARLFQSAPGRATQLNAGAHQARASILLFLHADTQLPAGYAKEVLRVMGRAGNVAGAFRFRTNLPSVSMKLIELLVELRCRILARPYGDQAIFVDREAFRQVAGFPERPLAEDLALVEKLKHLGRVALAGKFVLTSARRWRKKGIWKTTAINQLVLLGLALRIPPCKLRKLYE